MEMDWADNQIINTLQENARTSLDQLAHITGLSSATVQRRVKALRDSDVILREIAVIDPSKVGQRMSFVIMVELERERPDQIDIFVRRAMKDRQVQQCYYVTGEADFCLICTAKDMEDFEKLTHRLFFEDSNVRRFRTSVVMGRKKVGLGVFLDDER
ncbi:Lrp/AsnC family transcriptional regulator [Cognatishimia activa]|uniref:Leucine-responsive regulatory protein n=1 Tax=Cognatishimia activa TaxID=1715691 RepID=A0A0P1IPK0_9RHOB|nr:Lrp/AsnC family transcriptional regulator [Cognatishimia activa]CUI85105.1 Leucine-responsive regulatory protein [Cognatishimia activa]CUK25542.1 Leucine-responsive regulatory protein [Cognatishimia activa]